MSKQKQTDFETGLISSHKLNEMILHESKRADGSTRIQYDFTYCPSLTEQHQAHMTDLNFLIEKYKPDELAAYIAARSSYRAEILGHDFSQEPSLQDAKQIVYDAKKIFENLDPDVRSQFRSTLDFIKFIDNPANAEKMLKLGLLTPQQVKTIAGETKTETDASKTRDTKDDVGGRKGTSE